MRDEFRLVDLEIIKRYSLAVRQESAPAEEILAALDASREAVIASMGLAMPRRRRGAGEGDDGSPPSPTEGQPEP